MYDTMGHKLREVNMKTTRRPNGSAPDPVRSVRISDATWNKARRRADYEKVTMSHVLLTLVEGYAEGYMDLPKIQVTYARPRS